MFTQDQQHAYDILCSGRNCYVTGSAGTGKTHLIQQFIADHRDRVIACASTGLAAQLLGGTTIHRLFNLSTAPCPRPGKKHLRILECTDTIVIDEISMVRMDVFDYVCGIIHNEDERKVLESFYGRRVGYAYAFQSDSWAGMRFEPVILKEVVRQEDSRFSSLLDRIKTGDSTALNEVVSISEKHPPHENAVKICSLNNDAEALNRNCLDQIPQDELRYQAIVTGDVRPDEIPCRELVIKPGCRVMCTANLSDSVVNGSFGTVIGPRINAYDGCEEIRIQWDDGEKMNVQPAVTTVYTYLMRKRPDGSEYIDRVVSGTIEQYPLRLAYAITIHKSQGQTLDACALYASSIFAPGQIYVALSRVRRLDHLSIIGDISVKCLVSEDVLKFYDQLELQLEQSMEMAVKQKSAPSKRGRKSQWDGLETKLIRIPVAVEKELLEYAHYLVEQKRQGMA